jgi:hypothetical protein
VCCSSEFVAMVQALHQTHGRHRAWDALAQTGPQSWFGFRLLFNLSLGADGFIQATRVIVWVGKDQATARGRRGKQGTVVGISPHRENIKHVAGEVDSMGLARCLVSLCSALHWASLAPPLSGGLHSRGVPRVASCLTVRSQIGMLQSSSAAWDSRMVTMACR